MNQIAKPSQNSNTSQGTAADAAICLAVGVGTAYLATKHYVHDSYKLLGLFDGLAAERAASVKTAKGQYETWAKQHPITAILDETGEYFTIQKSMAKYNIGVRQIMAENNIVTFPEFWSELTKHQKTKTSLLAAGAMIAIGSLLLLSRHEHENIIRKQIGR